MIEQKEIIIKIDTKELEEKIEETITEHIEQIIFEFLDGNHRSYVNNNFRDKIYYLFKKALREIADLDSKEIRREVKQEVIDRSVEKITSLDKKEVLKTLLTK